MKIDKYTKIVLTMIALILMCQLLKDIKIVPDAIADQNKNSQILEVKIVGCDTVLPVTLPSTLFDVQWSDSRWKSYMNVKEVR